MKTNLAAIILIVVLIFSIDMGFAYEANSVTSQTEDARYDNATFILRQLGLFQQPEGDEFSYDSTVTRAELCMMVYNTGYASVGAENNRNHTYFVDMPYDHWATTIVNSAFELGIISRGSDNRFYPEREATYQEAISMFVNMLGYKDIAKAKGDYPVGYIMTGRDIGLTQGVNADYSKPIKRKDIIMLIYNLLDIPFVQSITVNGEVVSQTNNNTTILSRMDIEVERGHIEANYKTSLAVGGAGTKKGYVRINGKQYKIKSNNINDYLGYEVKIYNQKTDNEDVIIAFEVLRSNETLHIEGELLNFDNANTSLNKLYYYDSNESVRATSAEIADGAVFIYNGRSSYPRVDMLNIESGSITLVDNKMPGKGPGYNIVFINEYKNYIVEGVNADDGKIYIKNNTINGENYINVDESDSSVILTLEKAGNNITLRNISGGDSISVMMSEDGRVIRIDVLNKFISGKVTQIYRDGNIIKEITIGDKSFICYESNIVENNMGISIDIEVDIYLDKHDKVFYIRKSNKAGKKYGYITDIGEVVGLGSNYIFRMMTYENTALEFKLAKRVLVKNVLNEEAKLVNITVSDAMAFERIKTYDRQLLVYDLDSNGDVNMIEFSRTGDLRATYENFLSKDYTTANDMYGYGRLGKVHITSETKIFVMNYIDDKCNYETSSVYSGGYFSSGSRYPDTLVYDVKNSGVAGAVLVTVSANVTKAFQSEDPPIAIIDRITHVIDELGVEQKKIYAYVNGALSSWLVDEYVSISSGSVTKPNTTTPYTIFELKRGDIFVYEANKAGKIDRYKVMYVRDTNPEYGPLYYTGGGYVGAYATAMQLMYGKVFYKDSSVIRLMYSEDNFMTFNSSGTYNVYRYDSVNDKLYVATSDDILSVSTNDLTNNSEVILNGNRNRVRAIVIYE